MIQHEVLDTCFECGRPAMIVGLMEQYRGPHSPPGNYRAEWCTSCGHVVGATDKPLTVIPRDDPSPAIAAAISELLDPPKLDFS